MTLERPCQKEQKCRNAGVAHLPPPRRSAVSKLLVIRHDMLVGRWCLDPEGHYEFFIAWICKSCKVNIKI